MNSGKIKTGIGAADIVALVFVIIGGVFAAVSIAVAGNLSAIQAHSTGDARLFPIIFGSVGVPFLVIGLVIGCISIRKRAGIRRVVREGYYVMADVVNIRPNFSVTVNGVSPYVVECHYRDPATGALHVFKSRNLFFYPAELEGKQLRVYVDRDRMKRYYVDVDALLPDVQLH